MATDKEFNDEIAEDFPDIVFEEPETVEEDSTEGDAPAPVAKDTKKEDTPADETEGPQLTDIEQEAYAQGWRPKDEYVEAGGNPKGWRDAAWWLDRGELLGQQKELKKEISQIKNAFIKVAEMNKQVYIKGRQDALRELKNQKKEAMREGDLSAVADLDDKIEEVQEELTKPPETPTEKVAKDLAQPVDSGVKRMYNAWLQENDWYTKDETLHNYANAVIKKFVDYNPDASQEEALQFVTENVRNEFPHKFGGDKKKNTVVSPSMAGKGTKAQGSTSGSNNSIEAQFNKIVAPMDPETKRAVADMIRSGFLTKKEYVESYNS